MSNPVEHVLVVEHGPRQPHLRVGVHRHSRPHNSRSKHAIVVVGQVTSCLSSYPEIIKGLKNSLYTSTKNWIKFPKLKHLYLIYFTSLKICIKCSSKSWTFSLPCFVVDHVVEPFRSTSTSKYTVVVHDPRRSIRDCPCSQLSRVLTVDHASLSNSSDPS